MYIDYKINETLFDRSPLILQLLKRFKKINDDSNVSLDELFFQNIIE